MAALRLTSHAFKYGGQIGTHLIVGGVDTKGPQLIECSNDGNMYSNPFHTTGSGSLAAMAILETHYKEDMEKEDAMKLCVAAIEAGIYHDLGSGSNVDVCVITKGKVEMFRNLKQDNQKIYSKPGGYQFKKDRVQVLEEFKQNLVVSVSADVPMDLS
jgi:20S proteasome subunit beta 2